MCMNFWCIGAGLGNCVLVHGRERERRREKERRWEKENGKLGQGSERRKNRGACMRTFAAVLLYWPVLLKDHSACGGGCGAIQDGAAVSSHSCNSLLRSYSAGRRSHWIQLCHWRRLTRACNAYGVADSPCSSVSTPLTRATPRRFLPIRSHTNLPSPRRHSGALLCT